MYQHQGLNDVFFLMLYGAAAMFALVACCYLLFRRVNVIADSVASPVGLRRWAAAFLAAVAADTETLHDGAALQFCIGIEFLLTDGLINFSKQVLHISFCI